MKKLCPNPYSPIETILYYMRDLKRKIKVEYKSESKKYEKLKSLRESKNGKESFVLANGPSVNKLDPEKLLKEKENRDADLFCVNYFPLSKLSKTVGPEYLVLSDPYSFELGVKKNRMCIDEAEKSVKKIFVPARFANTAKGSTNVDIVEFNDERGAHIFGNSIDPTKPRSYISMTAYKALAISIYLGYERIFICGFDNTYVRMFGCDKNNRIYRTDEHFSEKSYPNDDEKDMWLEENVEDVKDVLFTYSRLFRDLKKFKGNGVVNMDAESLTDAFPKSNEVKVYK
jgi:hypothetical protein